MAFATDERLALATQGIFILAFSSANSVIAVSPRSTPASELHRGADVLNRFDTVFG